MASLGGKKPKPVHEREWEKLISGQIPCTSIKSVDETIRFHSDRGKWYFHLTYNPVGHSKSKRVTVEDPDESYVLGTRQRLLASPLFKQQSAQDLPSAAPPPPPNYTTRSYSNIDDINTMPGCKSKTHLPSL